MSWWHEFYDSTFADVFLATVPEETTAEAAHFLAAALRLSPGDRVFDQCCGTGRLALRLAAMGYVVDGVEASAAYVARARSEASRLGLAVEVTCADAREHAPRAPCAGAFNWATSFGHAEDDASNARMLGRATAALAPGGRFALDYYSAPFVLRAFKERMESVHALPQGEALVVREARIDFARGLLDQRWTYALPSSDTVVRSGATRFYMPHELARMMGEAGLVDVALFGGTDGRPFDMSCPRCILVGQKA